METESLKPKIIRISTVPLSLKMFCSDLLTELSDEYDVLAVSSAGAELDDLSRRGIPVRALRMERAISPLKDLRSLWQLIRLLRRERPHMVHSMTPKAGLLAMIAAWVVRVPVRIHSFTGLLFPTASGVKRRVLVTTDRITCWCATHVLPEGHGVKADLERAHITSKPLRVLANGNLRGINLDHYRRTDSVMSQSRQIVERMGIPEDAFTFVFVGRIVSDKGIGELAEAFGRLVASWPKAHLVLVGAEEPTEDPLSPITLERLDATANIHRTRAWADDVRPYYAMADALVFPSYREGFPNVVLEAGAMGLPSIVTDINGSREIVKPGVNGDIVPAHDANALYKAMVRYVSQPPYVKSMSENCREIIAQNYEASYVRSCLKHYYRNLCPNNDFLLKKQKQQACHKHF